MTGTTGRPFRPADAGAVVELFARSFGHPTSPAHYRWKHLSRPDPGSRIRVAADQQDRPVFHSAGIPCGILLDGIERRAMTVVDVMTDPAFRRRGILTREIPLQFAGWRDAGVALVLGIPNEQWGSRAGATGWRPLVSLDWLWWPLRPERALASRTGLGWLEGVPLGRWWNASLLKSAPPAGVEIREWDGGTAGLDQLWATAARGLSCSLVRDAAWVGWRYRDEPDAGYHVLLARRGGEPAGYAAFRLDGSVGLLADVFTAPGDGEAFTALALESVRLLLARGANVARALAPRGSVPWRALRRAGFFPSRHGFSVQFVLLDAAIDGDALRDPGRWYLMGGDFDVV